MVQTFNYIEARSIEEAVAALGRYEGRARLIAGGTDLLGKMKDRVLPGYPEALVNLKSIPGLTGIREEKGELVIGALTRLADVAAHPGVRAGWTALAEAARRTASPQLREMGTLGGNLCQDVRCWYYRHPDNRFPCLRKGGGRCYAIDGDNRYHAIFGGSVEQGCYAVHPSDTAPALVALDARLVTSKRTLPAADFFTVGVSRTTALESDEILTEVRLSAPPAGAKSAFIKFAIRRSIDFPIVNCAARVVSSNGRVSAARVCLNAVAVTPYRPKAAEETLVGAALTEASAEAAGEAAIRGARPLEHNGYMVQIARTLVKRAVLACA
jgi:xanthine dehydrogenase YagS FAD-binding subunit